MFIKSAWRICHPRCYGVSAIGMASPFFVSEMDPEISLTPHPGWGDPPKQTSCHKGITIFISEIFTIFHVQTWSKTSVLVFELANIGVLS